MFHSSCLFFLPPLFVSPFSTSVFLSSFPPFLHRSYDPLPHVPPSLLCSLLILITLKLMTCVGPIHVDAMIYISRLHPKLFPLGQY
ncbi:hypothetical protein BDQ17DRAFT_1379134 [Cyathus striatus]|nr:hypothetical protein BDQ17DRAFT_1379134 [Cyathus striatus]